MAFKIALFCDKSDLDLLMDFFFKFENFGAILNPDFVHGDISQFRYGVRGQNLLNFFEIFP